MHRQCFLEDFGVHLDAQICLVLALSWLHVNKLWPMTCIAVEAWLHAQADKPLWEHARLAKQSGDHISLCIWPHQYIFKNLFIA